MFYLIKSKVQIAAICIILIVLLFVIHEMFSSDSQSPGNVALKFDSQASTQVGKTSDFIRQLTSAAYKMTKKFDGEKIVHLDLKGAPPLVSYFEKLFPYLKLIGATGLLVEYEDMFPYTGALDNIPAYNAYTLSDVSLILKYAAQNGLKVIPLVQTFGHLEFVLKLQNYKELREVPLYPQVICPTHNNTPPLLFSMIDQVIDSHPGITHIHIGSDEVYHLGLCDRCTRSMEERGWSKEQLFLSHLRNVTTYIKWKYPHIRPIIWDDELRSLNEGLIEEFEVAKYTDIMVWKYTQVVAEFITDAILDKYARIFKSVWIASAFKGASGPDSMITDVRLHLENHVSWMELVDRWKGLINFKGIVLTGWQRYDHFAILCEILPVAIPSLTMCMQYLEGKEVDENVMSSVLNCEFPIAWGEA